MLLIYLMYELAFYFQLGTENKFIDTTFYYIVPYGVLTFLGYNYLKIKDKKKIYITLISFILFISCGIFYWNKYKTIQSVQITKYPP